MLHPDTWSYGDEEAKLFSISVVSQENFRIYWSLWVCSPWDETSPGRWLTPPPLSDSLFHILWISQLVSEFTSLQTWNICDIKHSWLSNRSVINDRTEEVITEDLFWTLNRPVFIILASLKMSLLFIYRSPWWLIDGFVIRVAWKTGTENSEFKFRLRTGLHAHTHTHTAHKPKVRGHLSVSVNSRKKTNQWLQQHSRVQDKVPQCYCKQLLTNPQLEGDWLQRSSSTQSTNGGGTTPNAWRAAHHLSDQTAAWRGRAQTCRQLQFIRRSSLLEHLETLYWLLAVAQTNHFLRSWGDVGDQIKFITYCWFPVASRRSHDCDSVLLSRCFCSDSYQTWIWTASGVVGKPRLHHAGARMTRNKYGVSVLKKNSWKTNGGFSFHTCA